MMKFGSNLLSSTLKVFFVLLLLFNVQISKAQWFEDWLYLPEKSLLFDYSYVVNTKGTEIYPISFGVKYIYGWDEIGVSVGAIMGGSWKKKMPQLISIVNYTWHHQKLLEQDVYILDFVKT